MHTTTRWYLRKEAESVAVSLRQTDERLQRKKKRHEKKENNKNKEENKSDTEKKRVTHSVSEYMLKHGCSQRCLNSIEV